MASVGQATRGEETYRAARRILERVSWTRQTSRLFFRPYSPTSFNSESLESYGQSKASQRRKQRQATAQWPVRKSTHRRAASKGRRGTLAVFEYESGAMVLSVLRVWCSGGLAKRAVKFWAVEVKSELAGP